MAKKRKDFPPSRRPESPTPDVAPGNGQPVIERSGIWYRSDRPRILGYIGWLCAGIGYVGFFLRGSQLPALFGMDMSWLVLNYKPMQFTRYQFLGVVFFLISGMLLSLLCMSAGLGLLKMREWGRRCAVYFAIGGILHTLLHAAFQMVHFESMLDFQTSTTQQFDRTQEGNIQFFVLVVTAGVQIAALLLLWLTVTRTYIKDAVAGAEKLDRLDRNDWQSP